MNSQHNSDTFGTAIRFKNPYRNKHSGPRMGRDIFIEPLALQLLNDINGYDKLKVCKGIEDLASIPSPQNGAADKVHPNFFKSKYASATVFNYYIKYTITSAAIIITNIKLDHSVLGEQENFKNERAALYTVSRIGKVEFKADSTLEEIKQLESKSWRRKSDVTKVRTRHAAVNGMLNDLEKATWLMGVHAQIAFPDDKVEEFTLFHNPTVEFGGDMKESVMDKYGHTTELAKQLSAVLRQIQKDGQPVKWIVHSQGGIIFTEALAHHIRHYANQSLNLNCVVFHAGGNNKKKTDELLAKVGIKRAAPDRDNPFDIVPNIAGGNHLSPAAIVRSLRFFKKVRSDNKSIAESPHTLPYLGASHYSNFLRMAGEHDKADLVERYEQRQQKKNT